MTIAGYNTQGDLNVCARESDQEQFLAQVKKLAAQRSVSERTIMLWCYLRADSLDAVTRIKGWIQELDQSQKYLMPLPLYSAAD